jgi:hypothetical protein
MDPAAHYIAYFDSSGRPEDHDGVIVGGCLSSVEQWQRMAPDWNRILEEEGVGERNGYRALHMKDLTSGRRAFAGWTTVKRTALLQRLAALIRARVKFIFAIGVPTSAYEASQVVLTKRTGWATSPLTFCAATCVQEVGGWCIRNGIEGPRLTYVFEEGDPNHSEIDYLIADLANAPRKSAEYRFAGLGYGGKHIVGLQVADWISYETFLWGNRQILPRYGEGTPTRLALRRSFVELTKVSNKIAYYKDPLGSYFLDAVARRGLFQ